MPQKSAPAPRPDARPRPDSPPAAAHPDSPPAAAHPDSPPAAAHPDPDSLRADARLNRDRVLEAAARAFARDGTHASLKAIAKDAGVGIGTLYRRFPTREQLVEAIYRSEVARIGQRAETLLAVGPPVAALRSWMSEFVSFSAAKQGMSDVLHLVLATDENMRLETRENLTGAVATLTQAAVADGSIRADVAPYDILLSLSGIGLVAAQIGQGPQSERLIDLLMDALRPHPAR
jgi:AcrR family transcriptional regulator